MQKLSAKVHQQLLQTLQNRFEQNMHRHQGLKWSSVQRKLEKDSEKMWSLQQMEDSGGEPDVIVFATDADQLTFCDCAKESPKGRRSFCYDAKALKARKKFKPKNDAQSVAGKIGAKIVTEDQYRFLQELEAFDTKTSSWVETPASIRKLGGALFCDRRYDHVFTYHNGADSYYASRGFRCVLRI